MLGAVSIGADEELIHVKPSTSTSNCVTPVAAACSNPPKKKIKISNELPETAETKPLSTAELQRLVLLEQLKLCRMQQEEILRRKHEDNLLKANIVTEQNKVFYNL